MSNNNMLTDTITVMYFITIFNSAHYILVPTHTTECKQ